MSGVVSGSGGTGLREGSQGSGVVSGPPTAKLVDAGTIELGGVQAGSFADSVTMPDPVVVDDDGASLALVSVVSIESSDTVTTATPAVTDVIQDTGQVVSGTGGTVSDINGYKVHVLAGGQTFTPDQPSIEVEVLLIGSGGGGGALGGGGGAGAVVLSTLTVTSATTVVVGAGGLPAASTSVRGQDGGAVTFGSLTAPGGGGGGSCAANGSPILDGNPGGSGGGGGAQGGDGGAGGAAGAVGLTSPGGIGQDTAPYKCGGGGGAGGAGDAFSAGGDGGLGYDAAAFGLGRVAGGGGGGGWDTQSLAGDGTDGGGNGHDYTGVATAATTYGSGGGGGGGVYSSGQFANGTKGAEGVVALRYVAVTSETGLNPVSVLSISGADDVLAPAAPVIEDYAVVEAPVGTIAAGSPATSISDAITVLSPIVHLPLNGSGGTTSPDVSGNNHEGTWSGTRSVGDIEGPNGLMYAGFGPSGMVSIPDHVDFDVAATGMTLVALIRPPSTGSYTVMAKVDGATPREWELYHNSATDSILSETKNASDGTAQRRIAGVPGRLQWSLLVTTIAGAASLPSIHVNDSSPSPDDSPSSSIGTWTDKGASIRLGAYPGNAALQNTGHMAHCAMFAGALSQAQIQSLVDAAVVEGWITVAGDTMTALNINTSTDSNIVDVETPLGPAAADTMAPTPVNPAASMTDTTIVDVLAPLDPTGTDIMTALSISTSTDAFTVTTTP